MLLASVDRRLEHEGWMIMAAQLAGPYRHPSRAFLCCVQPLLHWMFVLKVGCSSLGPGSGNMLLRKLTAQLCSRAGLVTTLWCGLVRHYISLLVSI